MKLITSYIKAIKNWRNWYGRTSLGDYWLFQAANVIISLILFGIVIIFNALGTTTLLIFSYITLIIYALMIILPNISISIRRLHDTDRSGGMYFVQLIPTIGEIWFTVLMLLPGTRGGNYYGPDPREENESTDNSGNGTDGEYHYDFE